MDIYKIVAVVVTYNRLECLKKVISCLQSQQIKLFKILVVNNGSTDGTTEWLNDQNDILVFHQDNVGGSGGFYRGISEALKFKSDWIWCMDDDVYPKEDCLKNLLIHAEDGVGILCPQRVQNNKVFISEFKKLNLSNPFQRLHLEPLTLTDVANSQTVEIMGMVFEGPLIRRSVVETIGLPTKDLFILYDDTDYSYRAVVAGYKVLYVPNAVMSKEYFCQELTNEQRLFKNRWKEWYHIRNTAYFCHHHGKNVFFRLFGELYLPFYMFFAIIYNLPRNKKYKNGDQWTVWKMFVRGHKGLLGKM